MKTRYADLWKRRPRFDARRVAPIGHWLFRRLATGGAASGQRIHNPRYGTLPVCAGANAVPQSAGLPAGDQRGSPRAADFQSATRQAASLRYRFAAALSLLAAAVLAVGCGRHSEPPRVEESLPTVPVRVQPVVDQPRPLAEEVVGTVHAKTRATLEAKVAGRIAALPVVLGQSLKADELVARLDVGEIRAKLDQARAVLEQARRDRDRFTALLRQQAVTPAEFDGVEARFRMAEAAVAEAETMLGYAEVRAPFDGVITRKLADVGDLASPGRPLVELEDPKSLRLEADVPEALIGNVRLNAKLPVRLDALTAELEGVVAEVAPAADPNSRTFRVKLDLPDAPELKSGLFGRVAVPVGETRAPRVPASALVRRGQMEMVFVVSDGRAHMRLVKAGKRFDREVELVSGVGPGERVVVEGAAALVDGQPVEVR